MSNKPEERATCETCPAWVPKEIVGKFQKGECRARPPVFETEESYLFPKTSSDDFCMEHPELRGKFRTLSNSVEWLGECIQNLEGFLRSR